MRKVSAEPCTCVRCSACDGTGSYWVDIGGRYIGSHRSDDLSEMEYCEECSDGIVEVCDRCQLLEEMDHESEWMGRNGHGEKEEQFIKGELSD